MIIPPLISAILRNEAFSRHASYADTDEMRRGMYLREYTALCELENLLSES